MARSAPPRLTRLLTLALGLASLTARAGDEPARSPALPRIGLSADGKHLVRADTGARFVPWGVNYDHDGQGRLIEDYWHTAWPTVEADFAEIKALGGNIVRVHLQLGRFLDAPDRPNRRNLERLAQLIDLARRNGLYLDLTGLACYHKGDVPAWYDGLDEAARWAAQATFWRAVAGVARDQAAVFCYDLMNEPILTGGDQQDQWLPGPPLDGKHFVQRITRDAKGRDEPAIARAWIKTLTDAIRSVDRATLITVGEIPWSQPFPGYQPLLHRPDVGASLDFASIHFYPRQGSARRRSRRAQGV